jgi:hypothetical protein
MALLNIYISKIFDGKLSNYYNTFAKISNKYAYQRMNFNMIKFLFINKFKKLGDPHNPNSKNSDPGDLCNLYNLYNFNRPSPFNNIYQITLCEHNTEEYDIFRTFIKNSKIVVVLKLFKIFRLYEYTYFIHVMLCVCYTNGKKELMDLLHDELKICHPNYDQIINEAYIYGKNKFIKSIIKKNDIHNDIHNAGKYYKNYEKTNYHDIFYGSDKQRYYKISMLLKKISKFGCDFVDGDIGIGFSSDKIINKKVYHYVKRSLTGDNGILLIKILIKIHKLLEPNINPNYVRFLKFACYYGDIKLAEWLLISEKKYSNIVDKTKNYFSVILPKMFGGFRPWDKNRMEIFIEYSKKLYERREEISRLLSLLNIEHRFLIRQ